MDTTIVLTSHRGTQLGLNVVRENAAKIIQLGVLLPWATPQRLFGLVHPEDIKCAAPSFVVHFAFAYFGGIGMQAVGGGQVQVVEGPKLMLPYDLIDPVDVAVYQCPYAIWLCDQSKVMQEKFVDLLFRQVDPPRIVAPSPIIAP